MPQPLRLSSKEGSSYSIRRGNGIVLERPHLAGQIGNVIANWTEIERDMLIIYNRMMGDYIDTSNESEFYRMIPEGVDPVPPSHPIAFQIFSEVISLDARLNLIGALCKWREPEDQYEEFTNILRHEIRRRYTERNKLAHGEWGINDDYPDALILSQHYEPDMVYKLQDFEEISARILKLHISLMDFHQRMYQRRVEKMKLRLGLIKPE